MPLTIGNETLEIVCDESPYMIQKHDLLRLYRQVMYNATVILNFNVPFMCFPKIAYSRDNRVWSLVK